MEIRGEENIVWNKQSSGESWSTAALLSAALGVGLSGAVVCRTRAGVQEKRPTAREVIAAIQGHAGVPWKAETVDTFKAGNPETRVTWIAVTMMATLDVLQRAAAKEDNLVITHEPTFYNHLDRPEGMEESDAVWKEKREFIEKNGMLVWRFHDHWHLRKPDGILAGMVQALGWEKYQSAENPQMKVTRLALSPGAAGFEWETHALEMENVEVLLVGETREWETVEYAADAATEGKRKGLMVIGHVPSEQAGMEECTRWLKTFVKDVPIELVATRQPFWTPTERSGRR